MKSAQRLEKYQTCIVPEAVVVERKNFACTRVVVFPTPLAAASPLYAALSPLAVDFPFVAPRTPRGLRRPYLTQSTTCINNAIQHTKLAMLLPTPA
jgi:hypothetical protein